MKKRIAFLLAAAMLLTLVACAKTDTPPNTTEQPPVTTPEDTKPTNTPDAAADSKVLVVYYSASGNTEKVAGYIADALGADTFSIVPVQPYTSEDLNWRDESSRVNAEHDDPSLREMELEATAVENWADYDTVFIGYPIWWGIAAWPVDNFVKVNDFTGKTVIPFCTSSSSGLGDSGSLLAELAGTGDWQDGQRFSGDADETNVKEWVQSLHLD